MKVKYVVKSYDLQHEIRYLGIMLSFENSVRKNLSCRLGERARFEMIFLSRNRDRNFDIIKFQKFSTKKSVV